MCGLTRKWSDIFKLISKYVWGCQATFKLDTEMIHVREDANSKINLDFQKYLWRPQNSLIIWSIITQNLQEHGFFQSRCFLITAVSIMFFS